MQDFKDVLPMFPFWRMQFSKRKEGWERGRVKSSKKGNQYQSKGTVVNRDPEVMTELREQPVFTGAGQKIL